MTEQKKYLFGPVPSRRLGLSLGVDLVPFKYCPLDCVYCQLGKTTNLTIQRKEYVRAEDVLEELKQRIAQGLRADVITLSGSGEPTLNSSFGKVIEGIKKLTDIPVVVLTNATLFYDEQVRQDCAKADIVVPSLDAADNETFEKINRPEKSLTVEKLIDGLCKFRNEFTGKLWLEVFMVEGINTGKEQTQKLKEAIEKIKPDKIQLNTAVRPTAESGIERIPIERLESIAQQIGNNCQVVADYPESEQTENMLIKSEQILDMLKRRPCSLDDICAGLNIHRNHALKYIGRFENEGKIVAEIKNGKKFYKSSEHKNTP
ncbi:MAG: radical SAM protein [Phycisphaerae bacterium]|nr:radical SAM protein [Phycisphaerae bacterium]